MPRRTAFHASEIRWRCSPSKWGMPEPGRSCDAFTAFTEIRGHIREQSVTMQASTLSRSGRAEEAEEEEEDSPSLPDIARGAGLLYVTDQKPGVRRARAGRGFRYFDTTGAPIRDPQALRRFRALAIPPAWTDVWIRPSPRGHIQATGRDARGRKQYRYHPRWRQVRDDAKFDRSLAFGQALGPLRERLEQDLARRGLSRERVLAAAVLILDECLIRVGNEAYARTNGSYGLTTLRAEHVDVRGGTIEIRFRGKSGRTNSAAVSDRRVARIIRRCQELPAQELFQYVDEAGECRLVDSADVNEYLHQNMGCEFTAKDFRTWGGSVAALEALWEAGPAGAENDAKRRVGEAVQAAAGRLGNTPAVCRRCYVHPAVIAAYLDGSLPYLAALPEASDAGSASTSRLSPGEQRLLQLLRGR